MAPNQPAQLSYLAGYEAINCVVLASAPFQALAGSAAGTASLPTTLDELDTALAGVKTAVAPLEGPRNLRNVPLQSTIDRAVDEAQALIREATQARDAGRALQSTTAGLPTQIVAAVDRVQAQVNRAVINNQPDFAALGGIACPASAAFMGDSAKCLPATRQLLHPTP